MNLHDYLRDRLIAGGWDLERHGKHEVWKLHNQSFTLPTTLTDTLRKRLNYMAQIHRSEDAANGVIPLAQPTLPMEETLSTTMPLVTPTIIAGESINAVNARDLHAFLEVGKDFSTWMKERIASYDFLEHRDFEVFPDSGEKSMGRPTKDYAISLDMAKELAMIERSAKGKEARAYFIERDKKLTIVEKAVHELPQTYMEALAELMVQVKEREALACKVQEKTEENGILEGMVQEMEPKVHTLEKIAKSEGAHTLTESAKILDQPPRKFINWLYANGFIYRTNGNWTAYQKHIHAGLFEHKFLTIYRKDDAPMEVVQAIVTPKGITALAGMLGAA